MRILLLVLCLAFGSCATIVDGGRDQVIFNSRPSGAMVSIDGVPIGKTPVVGPVSRRWKRGMVKMELAGHKTFIGEVPREFNGWFLGNILIAPIIGSLVDLGTANCRRAIEVMAIDLVTGAQYETEPQRFARERRRKEREEWNRSDAPSAYEVQNQHGRR